VRTEELVALLASRAEAVDSKVPTRRYILAVATAAVLSFMLMDLWLGVRATLLSDFAVPMFWAKEVFCAVLGVAGLVAMTRLARPGTPLGLVPAGLAAPVVAMWLLAVAALYAADAAGRDALVFGLTSTVCPFAIALISVPLFCGIFWSMRKMAPTRLRLAGAAGGFALHWHLVRGGDVDSDDHRGRARPLPLAVVGASGECVGNASTDPEGRRLFRPARGRAGRRMAA